MKTFNKKTIISILVLGLVAVLGCKKDEVINSLTVNPAKIEFQKGGSSTSMTIQTDADSWVINNTASAWLVLSSNSGKGKTALITLSVNSKTIKPRIDTLKITAGNAKPVYVIVSQPSSEYLYSLASNLSNLTFRQIGNATNISISTDARLWNLSCDASWLQISKVTGDSGATSINITAKENTAIESRSSTITITAAYAPTVQISVLQKGLLYPSYNTSPNAPDATGMSSNASLIASKINLGWNIGNTLEATGGETAWGNPLITQALIDLVKKNGFNAIRIPCSWNQYMANNLTAQLKTEWLNRVKQVIQYCVNDDMYVLLNIHWDGGWLETNCSVAKQDENNAKQKAFWEQIATHLRDFDEHLLFASANEPSVSDATGMSVLNSYHQTFINAVRSTGGKNTYRVLVVQGPSTDIEKTNKLMTSLPTDHVPNRMMVEVHYYTPFNFCGLDKDVDWGKMFYYWGKSYHSTTQTDRNATWGEEGTVDANMKLMKTQFVDKGIPVILGEFGAVRHSELKGDSLKLHLTSRAYYFKYVVKQAKANGLLPFFWDAGGNVSNSSGVFLRSNNTIFDQQALDSLVQGAAK